MRAFIPALLLLPVHLAMVAGAQAQDHAAQRVAQERERITAQRHAADERYRQAETACYQQFAVNDCQNRAKAARREAMADLRRQEITLNDEERRRKAAAQQQRIDERSSPQRQQQAAEQRARALQDAAARDERGVRKAQAAPAAPPAPAQEAPAASAPAATVPPRDAAAARKHQERLDAVKARKAEVQKRSQDRTKPAAKPLPVPSS